MALIPPDGFNYWTSHKNASFAWWYGSFRSDKMQPREQILRFARVYEVVAEQTGILRPMLKDETDAFIPLKQATGLSYSEHLEQYFDEFEAHGKAKVPPYVYLPSRIAFYNESADIVEQEIDDAGTLLRKLRPDRMDHASRYMYPESPVDGPRLSHLYTMLEFHRPKKLHKDLYFKSHRSFVSFNLRTDIWFAKVLGWMEDHDSYDKDRWYDNLDLAERHTPRLNQFLQAMRDVFVEIEGAWEVDTSETLIRYRPLISETGITLD